MSSRRLRALAFGLGAVALAALAGSGCGIGGGKSSDASTATTVHDHASHDHGTEGHRPDVNPCTLVTEAQAAEVLGEIGVVKEGATGVVSDQRVCGLSIKSDERFGANLGLTDFEASRKFEAVQKRFSALAKEVPDVGDRAIWIKQFRLLLVQDGSDLVTVQMTQIMGDAEVTREGAIKLARYATGSLSKSSTSK